MAYSMTGRHIFRTNDTFSFDGRRYIVYEERELWEQTTPTVDSYWVTAPTVGATLTPSSVAHPFRFVQFATQHTGPFVLSNPCTVVGVGVGTGSIVFPNSISGATQVETNYSVNGSNSDNWGNFWTVFDSPRTRSISHLLIADTLPEPPVNAAPIVSGVSPPGGASIVRNQFIQFDVTDAEGLLNSIVMVSFPDGTYDVVFDGDTFAPKYATYSTRTAIAGGFRYMVKPVTGWTASPTIRIVASDTGGLQVL